MKSRGIGTGGLWRDPTDDAGHQGMFSRVYNGGRPYEWPDGLICLGAEADSVPAAVVAEPRAWDRQLADARDVRHLALEVERQGLDLGLGL